MAHYKFELVAEVGNDLEAVVKAAHFAATFNTVVKLGADGFTLHVSPQGRMVFSGDAGSNAGQPDGLSETLKQVEANQAAATVAAEKEQAL